MPTIPFSPGCSTGKTKARFAAAREKAGGAEGRDREPSAPSGGPFPPHCPFFPPSAPFGAKIGSLAHSRPFRGHAGARFPSQPGFQNPGSRSFFSLFLSSFSLPAFSSFFSLVRKFWLFAFSLAFAFLLKSSKIARNPKIPGNPVFFQNPRFSRILVFLRFPMKKGRRFPWAVDGPRIDPELI